MKCALCHDEMEIDHPDNIYEYNPQTFRKAWMHFFCYSVALEDIQSVPASYVQYDNRQDEYYTRLL